MDFLYQLDLKLLALINQRFTWSILDQFIPWFIDLHKGYGFWILVIIILVTLYRVNRGAFWFGLFVLICLGINDFIGSQIKNWFLRERPNVAGVHVLLRCPHFGGPSFPSNHTANAFFVWGILPLRNKWLKYLLLGLALFIGYSRVYCGVHYPSDVLGGALLGLGWAWIAYRVWQNYLTRFLVKKIGDPTS